MEGDVTTPRLVIVCSDEGRNGKTLLARLYADYLAIVGGEPVVLDLDAPKGGVARFYPDSAEIVDINSTRGQISLFDTILAAPDHDYVIDLPDRDLNRFFEVYDEIGFAEEARAAGLESLTAFIVDKKMSSLHTGRELLRAGRTDRFTAVYNRWLGDMRGNPQADLVYRQFADGDELALPELDRSVFLTIEEPPFSFREFWTGDARHVPAVTHGKLSAFLDQVYGQLRNQQLRLDLLDLNKLGLI